MATQCFLVGSLTTSPYRYFSGHNSARLDGDTGDSFYVRSLSLSRGSGAVSLSSATVTGPTNGLEIKVSTTAVEFISAAIDQDVTISGTITLNLRASENNMSANVAINAIIERLDSQGAVVSTIAQTARTTELGTSEAAANFTVTPTSTAMLKGDRIRIRVYGDDAGTMATGFTFTLWINGPTAGASGDSYVTFTETFDFQTTDPTGTKLFLTNVAGPAVGANIEKEMWSSRGDGVNSIDRSSTAGWTAPLQWTDSGGGTAVEWYSKQLQAFTLAGVVLANIRALSSDSGINTKAAVRAELARVDSDGSNPVIWGTGSINALIENTEGAHSFYISGDDLSVSDGQRLRLRIYADDGDAPSPMTTGKTLTLFYDGTSDGASGDSWIQLSQTVSEFVTSVPSFVARRKPESGLVLR